MGVTFMEDDFPTDESEGQPGASEYGDIKAPPRQMGNEEEEDNKALRERTFGFLAIDCCQVN